MFSDGNSAIIQATTNFIAVAPSIAVAAGQKIFVVSTAGLGTTLAGGADGLDLWICYRASAGPITPVGGGVFGLSVSQNTRHMFTLSAIIPVGSADTYQVGLCGRAVTPAEWNSNEWSYTSALVFQ